MFYCTTDTRVGVEYGTIIMRTRNEKGWTQRDLAQVLTVYSEICVQLFCFIRYTLNTYIHDNMQASWLILFVLKNC